VFIGEGAMKRQLQSAAHNCPNVRFFRFFPVEDIPYVMAAGDLHVVTIKRGLEGVVVPSKMYNILAAGRPLLAVATDKAEVTRIAAQDGCGVSADPDRPREVADVVRQLLRSPDQLKQMSLKARAQARLYQRTNELGKFVAAVENAIPNHSQH